MLGVLEFPKCVITLPFETGDMDANDDGELIFIEQSAGSKCVKYCGGRTDEDELILSEFPVDKTPTL